MIKASNLNKSYTGEVCLKNINLSIAKGEFVSVMGESGSGKTTLLEILTGVRTPDSGEIVICGKNILSMSNAELSKFRRTKIGVVYQTFALIPTLTAAENIKLPLMLEKIPKKECEQRVNDIAEKLNIGHILSKLPRELSGGQQQRVAIARAAVYNPDILFLDEPTGSLDSENSENVMRFLFDFSKSRGTTVFQITHSEKAASGTKIISIKDGAVTE